MGEKGEYQLAMFWRSALRQQGAILFVHINLVEAALGSVFGQSSNLDVIPSVITTSENS